MTDTAKSKKQLIEELEQLRLRIKGLGSEVNAKRDSEERYKQIVLSTQDSIILFDIITKQIIDINRAAETMYGYSREELLKMTYNDITAEQAASNDSIKCLESEQSVRVPVRLHKRKDGTVFPVEISGSFIPFYTGAKVACGIIRDITERKKAEETLKEAKAFTETTLNTIDDIFYAFDLNGKFLKWNEALSRVTGYTDEELYSMTPTDFFEGEDIKLISKSIETVFKEGRSKQEAYLVLKDGRQIPYEFTGSVMKDHHGNISGFSGTGRDITDRKQAQKENEKLIMELRDSLTKIKTLSGMLPICSSCKKIRNDDGYWEQVEVYISSHSEAEFSNGICPDCGMKLYPGI